MVIVCQRRPEQYCQSQTGSEGCCAQRERLGVHVEAHLDGEPRALERLPTRSIFRGDESLVRPCTIRGSAGGSARVQTTPARDDVKSPPGHGRRNVYRNCDTKPQPRDGSHTPATARLTGTPRGFGGIVLIARDTVAEEGIEPARGGEPHGILRSPKAARPREVEFGDCAFGTLTARLIVDEPGRA